MRPMKSGRAANSRCVDSFKTVAGVFRNRKRCLAVPNIAGLNVSAIGVGTCSGQILSDSGRGVEVEGNCDLAKSGGAVVLDTADDEVHSVPFGCNTFHWKLLWE
jgi:hypothetical protein